MLKFASLFLQHTMATRSHLTPELVLRLVTPACPLWRARESPFVDPYWAFYWPGGQATARARGKGRLHPGKRETVEREGILHRIYKTEIAHGESLSTETTESFMEFSESRLTYHHLPNLACRHAIIAGFVVFFRTIRYILDNKDVIRGRRVLEVGCGCGAGAIAAATAGAARVLANDIDPFAEIATKMNAKINNVNLETDTKNYIGTNCEEFDTILIGDMFYDEEFGNMLFTWLEQLTERDTMVLIGDPGRHGLTSDRLEQLTLLARYDMPTDSCYENNGFTETSVFKLNN